jgi:ATP-dependent Clp protease ATP-binding subunit ClpC
MFERYTEKARRIVFFARYEASEFGSESIETEHLLLGLLREDKAIANRFLPSNDSVAAIRQRIRALTPLREKISTSVDLPLSHESKRVLAYSAEEAEKLKQRYIGPEHMLLGLLREEGSLAANLLQERGLSIARVREEIAARGSDSPVSPGNALQTTLLKYLESHYKELGVSAAGPGSIRQHSVGGAILAHRNSFA